MRYANPILYADYSDPDVIRVGEDFYMIASSFTYLPGIPVLHSRDLAHWRLIGYAAARLPFARYDAPAHKCGTWAPSLRYHQGRFYVYVCLPDEGLFAFTAEDPAGEWTCHHVKDVTGWIDPCPLFDEDGRAWLIHGFAASRSGINNILYLHEMSPDGLSILDRGRLVYSGDDHGDETVEGPKLYKRAGRYWILCPAGGVATGYQLALRADDVRGPYERRVVLAQGNSPVNGPHQGGWVDDGRGGDWFLHFQDVGVYGRIIHLQPVDWSDGWPVMGAGGVPVAEGDTGLPAFEGRVPMSDEFIDGPGLQWQWQANPGADWCAALRPGLRLFGAPEPDIFHSGRFLSQLMQARDFDMDVKLTAHQSAAGLAMMGYTYHAIALAQGRVALRRGEARERDRWHPTEVIETTLAEAAWDSPEICLRMAVRDGVVQFYYGADGARWTPLGAPCPLACGGWVGARPGIFCLGAQGWADFAWVRVTANGEKL